MAIAMGALGSAVIGAGASAGGAGLFSGLGASLIGGGASLLGGFMRNTSSADQAFKQMAMQDYWLRNRHRIEIGDLEAAGLNPILSAGGQPPVPAGARAEMGDPITPAVGSAMQAATVKAALEKNAEEVQLLREQQSKTRAEARLTSLTGDKLAPGLDSVTEFREGREVTESGFQRLFNAEVQRARGEGESWMWEGRIREYESYIRDVAAKVAQHYGAATAYETYRELLNRADLRKWEALRARGHAQVETSTIMGIEHFPIWVKHAIEAAQGGSSAVRNFLLGNPLPRAGRRP